MSPTRPRLFAAAGALLLSGFELRAVSADPTEIAAPAEFAWVEDFRTSDAIHAAFTEQRQLPIRHEPLVLTGEIRFQNELGLSLHYLTPEARTVIVDESGVALRDARGRTRRAPGRSEAARSAAVLLHVLQFDFEALAADFTITSPGPGAEGTWQIRFTPKLSTTGLPEVVVRGSDAAVTSLTLGPGLPDQIDISIAAAERRPAFPLAERQRYFR